MRRTPNASVVSGIHTVSGPVQWNAAARAGMKAVLFAPFTAVLVEDSLSLPKPVGAFLERFLAYSAFTSFLLLPLVRCNQCSVFRTACLVRDRTGSKTDAAALDCAFPST